MVSQTGIDQVTAWITERWPGGEHIAPHWPDGPYWLHAVATGARGCDLDVLEGCELILPALPVCGMDPRPTPVYLVPQFVHQYLEWIHDPEAGTDTAVCAGPFNQLPAAADLVRLLPELVVPEALWDGDLEVAGERVPEGLPAPSVEEYITRALGALRHADPDLVMATLAAWPSGEVCDADALMDMLDAVNAVVTP